MAKSFRIPRAVIIGLLLAIVLDTVIQIAWKLSVAGIPDNASVRTTLLGVLSSHFFYVAMLAFPAQLFNWMYVLARADLSYAQPITALANISVVTISSRYLHEQLSPLRILGVALILIGVFFISQTPAETRHAD